MPFFHRSYITNWLFILAITTEEKNYIKFINFLNKWIEGSHNALCPCLKNIFQLSFLLQILIILHLLYYSQPQDTKRKGQNLAKLCSGLLSESCLSEFQILIISIFYVLCRDLIRAPTLQWGSITGGGPLSREELMLINKEEMNLQINFIWGN